MLVALILTGLSLLTYGCNSNNSYSANAGPRALVDKYFSSAVHQDYAKAYSCYYKEYHAKINQEEYIKHRKEASVLQRYKITSIKQNKDAAQAEVLLTFAPSEKLNRDKPVTVKVKEDLIKEDNQWKIKVW